ncbi:hypothetical protein [Clostridium manihotivorum]|uniref:DUF2441 domain-containing protein n=1 Tax=Clostridium manihotivorum TaxID=2320868 RepID=A0A3R5QS33_9CLOT|nr:hypothetical protein [Clostridium manihotivorum]QAA31176.1 hypothetical protein C1I91_05575 [Clostridium manihotivorum]
MKFYHMARKGYLSQGQVIQSRHIDNIQCMDEYTSSMLQDYFNNTFTNGVCVHGEHYFAVGGGYTYIYPITELLLEKGRQAIDKNLPSRVNAIFSLDNIDRFNQLCSLMKVNLEDYDIWEVESENSFRGDMFLIDTIQGLVISNQSILIASMLIDYYWKGEPLQKFLKSDEPFWEYLLQPPVKVIKKVNL